MHFDGPAKMRSFWRGAIKKMHYTYVLLLSNKKFYIGSTSNLKLRLKDHKNGRVKSTRQFLPLELVYFECCFSKTDAIKREYQLKTGFGRGYLRRRLENFLNNTPT